MFGPFGVEAIELIERSIAAEETVRHFWEKKKKKTAYDDDERVSSKAFLSFCSVFFGRERIYNGLVLTL